jgi:transcriptional regulator with XRE-family HTH domain
VALQRERQRHGLSQSQLAKLAKLSLKYIGEIERGEANVTMEALEQITAALVWDPFELPLRDQEALPQGVRTLLLTEMHHMLHLVQTAITWLENLDATLLRRATPPPGGMPPKQWPDENVPIKRRGRPRKPKPEKTGPAEKDDPKNGTDDPTEPS